jgi:hypothetical protein
MSDEPKLGECEVRRLPLADLSPACYNPRKIDEDSFGGLGASINRFGMLVPIIWNERSGNIVGGHQRYKNLMEAGETETDVVVVDLDDNDEVALNIVLNSKMAQGEFTEDVVKLLATSQAQLGNAFDDIKLDGLFDKMAKKKWPKEFVEPPELPETPEPPEPPEEPPEDLDPSPPHSSNDGLDEGPDALIVCPKCRSKWKMSSNEVVHDGSE